MTTDNIKAILLDIDGTLIDSNDAHAKAWVDAFEEAGIQVNFGDVRKCIGMGGDHLLPTVAQISKESPLGSKLEKRRGEIFRQKYLTQLKAFTGARDLLLRFKAAGFDLVVATSASTEDLNALLKQAKLEDLLEKRTDSSEAESSKPDPDIVQAAVKKAGVEPREALMIGDTPYDIEAAQKAGVDILGFTCGGWGRASLRGAKMVFEGPWDLLNQFSLIREQIEFRDLTS